jgi:hypothetical protein
LNSENIWRLSEKSESKKLINDRRLVCSKGEDDGDIPEDDFEEMQK